VLSSKSTAKRSLTRPIDEFRYNVGVEEKGLQLYRPDDYVQLAKADLSLDDQEILRAYIAGGGRPLSPVTSTNMFELFLNGSDAHEIHRLNSAFPLGGILDAQIRYKWTAARDADALERQSKLRDTVMRAQVATTELMSDMLVAANKQHSDKLKKFIQTGNEKDLDGALNIESLQSLMKVAEGLLKITGQDRVSKVKTENTQNLNVSLTGVGPSNDLSDEDAGKILEILSDAKRKKNAEAKK